MKNKRIYITGANGFIGHNLVNYLSNNNYEVFALVRKNSIPYFDLKRNVHVVIGDLTDKKSLQKVTPARSIVINLAANPYHPTLSYKVNVEGTKNLLDVCKSKKTKFFIQVSSQATKIKKQGVYAKTKNESDKLVKRSNLKYTILKPSLVYGGGEKGLFNKLKSFISLAPVVPVFGDGKTKFNPIHVKDFCNIVDLVIKNEKESGKTYDVGSIKAVTYNNFYELTVKYFGKKAHLLHIPTSIGILMGNIFSYLPFAPFYVDNVLGSTQETNCNPSPLLKKINYDPINLCEGLERTLNPKRLNIAIVGLGKMGLLHISILKTLNKVNIKALVDKNKALFATIRSTGVEGNFYEDYKTALKAEKVDAIYILTPTFTHYELLSYALKKNLHVFIEKPVALNINEIKKLKKIKSKSIVNVGYALLFNRTFSYVKEIIDKKIYGNVVSFKADFKHSEVFGPKKGWMFEKKKSGGGVLMNPGPHLFSLLNSYFGKPKKISGNIEKIYSKEVDDKAELKLNYDNYVGNVNLSWSEKGYTTSKNVIKIKFEKATIVVDGNSIEIIHKNSKKIVKYSQLPTPIKPIFNVNPQANGEAYYLENYFFINSLVHNRTNNINNLKFALDTESVIFQGYLKSKNK